MWCVGIFRRYKKFYHERKGTVMEDKKQCRGCVSTERNGGAPPVTKIRAIPSMGITIMIHRKLLRAHVIDDLKPRVCVIDQNVRANPAFISYVERDDGSQPLHKSTVV